MRGNGGKVGSAISVTSSAAKGIFSILEQYIYKQSGVWPLGGYTIIQTFTATSTWTCPTGVTEVEYLVVAGGGGGGIQTTTSGLGGGGGGGVSCLCQILNKSPHRRGCLSA